jgi:hypothetical protein
MKRTSKQLFALIPLKKYHFCQADLQERAAMLWQRTQTTDSCSFKKKEKYTEKTCANHLLLIFYPTQQIHGERRSPVPQPKSPSAMQHHLVAAAAAAGRQAGRKHGAVSTKAHEVDHHLITDLASIRRRPHHPTCTTDRIRHPAWYTDTVRSLLFSHQSSSSSITPIPRSLPIESPSLKLGHGHWPAHG